MDEKQRRRNETEFNTWIESEDGSRIYSFEVAGKFGWRAKYLKQVDINEMTLRFWQEIMMIRMY